MGETKKERERKSNLRLVTINTRLKLDDHNYPVKAK